MLRMWNEVDAPCGLSIFHRRFFWLRVFDLFCSIILDANKAGHFDHFFFDRVIFADFSSLGHLDSVLYGPFSGDGLEDDVFVLVLAFVDARECPLEMSGLGSPFLKFFLPHFFVHFLEGHTTDFLNLFGLRFLCLLHILFHFSLDLQSLLVKACFLHSCTDVLIDLDTDKSTTKFGQIDFLVVLLFAVLSWLFRIRLLNLFHLTFGYDFLH